MRVTGVFVFVLCATLVLGLTDEQKELAKKHKQECMKTIPVTQEVIDNARKGEFADDAHLKEFFFCFAKKAGIMNENGDYDKAVIRQKLGADAGDKIEEVVTECINGGTSRAEQAFEFAKCYHEKVPTHGI